MSNESTLIAKCREYLDGAEGALKSEAPIMYRLQMVHLLNLLMTKLFKEAPTKPEEPKPERKIV